MIVIWALALEVPLALAGVLLVRRRCFWPLLWTGAGLMASAAVYVACGQITGGTCTGMLALLHLWLWWRRGRGQRKRVAKLIGDKARALREKLTTSMPRWSPRLQPQGARA